jgi:hypothetical protein
MRGHSFASAGAPHADPGRAAQRTLIQVVPRNARTLMRAKQTGGTINYLSQAEIGWARSICPRGRVAIRGGAAQRAVA